jgi:hypothetical protein
MNCPTALTWSSTPSRRSAAFIASIIFAADMSSSCYEMIA